MPRGGTSQVGETRWSPNGYHYTRTTGGWELTHRLTAEEKLGRPLHANERIRFVTGFTKNDYANPNAIEVYAVRESRKAARAAKLRARIEELQAELAELENE